MVTHTHNEYHTMVPVYTCDDCEAEFFPHGTPGMIHDMHICLVCEDCIPEFLEADFFIVPGIVDGTDIPGLFCPHASEDEPPPPRRPCRPMNWN